MGNEINSSRQEGSLSQNGLGSESDIGFNWKIWAWVILGVLIVGILVYFLFFYGEDVSLKDDLESNESLSALEENISLNENSSSEILLQEENIPLENNTETNNSISTEEVVFEDKSYLEFPLPPEG